MENTMDGEGVPADRRSLDLRHILIVDDNQDVIDGGMRSHPYCAQGAR
jgi:hypothetical protein